MRHLSIHPFTDDEWETLAHLILLADEDWDPSNLDHIIADHSDNWFESVSNNQPGNTQKLLDKYGQYRNRQSSDISDKILGTYFIPVSDILIFGN